MPRLARLDAPGVLHHIIIRGIERRRIFNRSYAKRMCILRSWCDTFIIEQVEKRVMEIFGVEKDVIYSKGRRKIQVAARYPL